MEYLQNLELTYKNEYKEVYKSKTKNKKGELLIVEISKCFYDNNNKNSFPNLWLKYDYTKHLYNSVLWADCEIIDINNNCFRKYEPTSKNSDDGHRMVINFDWLFEVSDNNKIKLLNEVLRRFEESEED